MKKSPQHAFTIVELLIVIVVIAILAAISIVAYNGIQARSSDTKRISDMQSIVKALELYKVQNGQYPTAAYSGGGHLDSWEVSSKEASGEFLAPLKSYGFASGTPIDPINNTAGLSHADARAAGQYTYSYYRYPAGYGGCDASKGAFYVLGIMRTSTTGNAIHEKSPGFSCSADNWQNLFSWVTGGYER